MQKARSSGFGSLPRMRHPCSQAVSGPRSCEAFFATNCCHLDEKRIDYERTDVREYLVIILDPQEVVWHARHGDKLMRIPPDPDGLYRSTVFPGLWLDLEALLNKDLDRVIATLSRGLSSPEHTDFIAQLTAVRNRMKA